MTDTERLAILRRYVDSEISAADAADALGPGTAIVDVIMQARDAYGRLPDRQDAFNDNEYRRACTALGLSWEAMPGRPHR